MSGNGVGTVGERERGEIISTCFERSRLLRFLAAATVPFR